MSKWFERVHPSSGENYIGSRIRLARNWNEYAFPGVLNVQESSELLGRLQYGLDDIGSVEGKPFKMATFDKLNEVDKKALKERRIMNSDIAAKTTPVGILINEDEDASIILNGDDHIRMQFLAPGMALEELWKRADKMDDFINSRFEYAFDDKYGYLTSYPTSVGTGMRANAVVHLPTLSKNPQSRTLIEGLSRFGVNIRGVYGRGSENYGSLYDISNAKTLGQSEKEIIDMVVRIANQLNDQERKAREKELENKRTQIEDEAYKSYGILKYARTMSIKSGLTYLSQLMAGIADGIIIPEGDGCIYKLMLGMQPANLMQHADRPLDKNELNILRAEFLRENLPKIKEA